MEFLDSLDLDTRHKKSHRMRSWYLYEQYKSLEKHQLDAAKKLKNRSYQDKLLRQELTERRARRQLFDQFGACQSESRLKKQINISESNSELISVSNDEFFESFNVQEDALEERVTHETVFDDAHSQDLSTSNYSNGTDDMIGTHDQNDNYDYSHSVTSVVENTLPNYKCGDNTDFEFTIESEFTAMTVAQDIHKQLDNVKQNIEDMENVAKLQDDDKLSDSENFELDDNSLVIKESINSTKQKKMNNIILVWSRLVAFAYQLIQFNRGNCYSDYGSQFLTAVLACEVLRRGANRMCNILQPYVSPTKFADECDTESYHKNNKISRKSRKTFENKLLSRSKHFYKPTKHARRKYSENTWQPSNARRRLLYESKMPRHTSETLHRVPRNLHRDISSSSSSSIWVQNSKKYLSNSGLRSHRCTYKNAANPMLEIARYIDSILKDTANL